MFDFVPQSVFAIHPQFEAYGGVLLFCFVCVRDLNLGMFSGRFESGGFIQKTNPKIHFPGFKGNDLKKQQSPTNHRIIENVRTPTQDLYSFCVFEQGVH